MNRAHAVIIQGTGFRIGRSVIAAASCSHFAQASYRAAPFKVQNMSKDSFATAHGGEVVGVKLPAEPLEV